MTQFAVIGQQEQALGVRIEATNVKHANVAVDEVPHAWTPSVVFHRGNDPQRLVQRNHEVARRNGNPLIVHSDDNLIRVDPRAEFVSNLPIHADAPGADEEFAFASATEPGRCEYLLQPNPFVRRSGHDGRGELARFTIATRATVRSARRAPQGLADDPRSGATARPTADPFVPGRRTSFRRGSLRYADRFPFRRQARVRSESA